MRAGRSPGWRVRFLILTGAELLRDRCGSASIPLRLEVTTGGLLLDDATVALLDEQRIELCVEMNDWARDRAKGLRNHDSVAGSDQVMRNLRRALDRLDTLRVHSVFGPETLEALPRTVAFLAALGVRVIDLVPDTSAEWAPDCRDRMSRAYRKVAEMVVAHYRADLPLGGESDRRQDRALTEGRPQPVRSMRTRTFEDRSRHPTVPCIPANTSSATAATGTASATSKGVRTRFG